MVKVLIENKVDPSSESCVETLRGIRGCAQTPLLVTAKAGFVDIAQVLIRAGAGSCSPFVPFMFSITNTTISYN